MRLVDVETPAADVRSESMVTADDLIAGRYLVVQKGKRNYALVVAD